METRFQSGDQGQIATVTEGHAKIVADKANVFYGTTGLNAVSLAIQENQVTALIGPLAGESRRSCAASTA